MNDTNFDWDDLRLFLAVARLGGLAAAAEATGKSPPTLGRRMLAMERALGADLFLRQPRGYTLTEEGRRFLARVEPIEAGVAELSRLSPRAGRALVKISAGVWMTRLLCHHVAELGAGVAVTLRFIAADHRLDIARREAVIGIRNARPEEVGLAARRVGEVRFAAYAIDENVRPWARVLGNMPSARWVQSHAADAPVIEVSSPRNALDLARAGAARAVLPVVIGATEPSLTRLGPPIAALTHDQWLVTHAEDRFDPPVRRTLDRLHDLLSSLHRATT